MADDLFENEAVRIPITDVFDLHTVPPREVKPVIENYLEEAHRMGFRALRIIHGRGIGVQRAAKELLRTVGIVVGEQRVRMVGEKLQAARELSIDVPRRSVEHRARVLELPGAGGGQREIG